MAFAKRSPSSSQGNVGPGVAAVPLEDVFRDYFDALGHYDHVGAHRVLRVHAGALQGSAFPNVHATLTKLVQCEMLYCSLADLKQKWFRKDSLSVMYSGIADDVQRLAQTEATVNVDTKFFGQLFEQVAAYCGVRQRLVSVYRSMLNNPASLDAPSVIATLEQLVENNKRSFFHPYFALLRLVFMWEAASLGFLLRAQQAIAAFAFKDTMTCIYRARLELDQWRTRCTLSDVGAKDKGKLPHAASTTSLKPSPSSSSLSQAGQEASGSLPLHYVWLSEFLAAMMSKASLYFYNIIQKHESDAGGDAGKMSAVRSEFEHIVAMRSFHKKSDATIVALIYEVSAAEWEPFSLSGYQCPGAPYRPPTGLMSFPCIFSHPAMTFPLEHMPSVISIIMDNRDALSLTREAPVVFFDKRMSVLYLVSMVDPRVFLVSVFTDRRSAKETAVAEAAAQLTSVLRNTRIFEKLGKY